MRELVAELTGADFSLGSLKRRKKAGGKETCAPESRDVFGDGNNTPGRLGQKQSRGPAGNGGSE